MPRKSCWSTHLFVILFAGLRSYSAGRQRWQPVGGAKGASTREDHPWSRTDWLGIEFPFAVAVVALCGFMDACRRLQWRWSLNCTDHSKIFKVRLWDHLRNSTNNAIMRFKQACVCGESSLQLQPHSFNSSKKSRKSKLFLDDCPYLLRIMP